MSILYFIHTFLYSQILDATISRADFLIVEDDRFDFDVESHRMRYTSLFQNYNYARHKSAILVITMTLQDQDQFMYFICIRISYTCQCN